LRSEGFTDVTYISWRRPSEATDAVATGAVDITMQYVGPSIMQLDADQPIVVLAGIQPGCFEDVFRRYYGPDDPGLLPAFGCCGNDSRVYCSGSPLAFT
jgi:ABC-type nitrate/sulfonate/bicarbonate transport system substrate-binding protein